VPVSKPAAPRTDPRTDSRTRDAERSREAILAAACDEFAAHGLGGARVERIAERAALDKRLIYYYFKNKDALFSAVLEQAYLHIREAERQLHLADAAPDEAIRRLTEFTWNYYVEHPEFLRLLNNENLHGALHLKPASPQLRAVNSPLIETLALVLERGRRSGLFRGGVDPVQLYISIAALSYFYLSNHHTLTAIFGQPLMSARAHRERLAHVCEVVLGYVRA
jgi:AcrR family transcriptional regulator